MSDKMLTILRDIQRNTHPAGDRAWLEQQEDRIIEEAGAVPLKLLLGIPALLIGLLPLLFNYGGQIVPGKLAAVVGTFFGLFFTLPIVLLIFRIRKLGLGWFVVHTVGFAVVVFTLFSRADAAPVRWPASLAVALVFGLLVPLVVWRSWRQFKRDCVQWWKGVRADVAGLRDAWRPKGQGPRAQFFPIFRNFYADRRRKARFPSVPLAFLTLLHTVSIVALFHVPHASGAWGVLGGFGGAAVSTDSAGYFSTISEIPAVIEAKKRHDDLLALRESDSAALPLLLKNDSFWDKFPGERSMIFSRNGALQDSLRNPDHIAGNLMSELPHDSATWRRALERVREARRLAVRTATPYGDVDVAHAELRSDFRQSFAPAGSGTGDVLSNDVRTQMSRLEDFERAIALLRMEEAERATKLMTMDGLLVAQQASIFKSLNGAAQRRLARIINNVRVAGVYIFAAALLACASGWWGAARVMRHRKPPRRAVSRQSWLRYRQLEARRRGTYVLGCALFSLFLIPLLVPVTPERVNLSRPFTPFILPSWFLPAFIQQHVVAPVRQGAVMGSSPAGVGTEPVTTDPEPTDPGGLRELVRAEMNAALWDSAFLAVLRHPVEASRDSIISSMDANQKEVADGIGRVRRLLYEETVQ